MKRQDMARRLDALEIALKGSPELRDLLTAEEEEFMWKLAGEGPPDLPIRRILTGDERGAAILAKLDVRPRPLSSFLLDLYLYELRL